MQPDNSNKRKIDNGYLPKKLFNEKLKVSLFLHIPENRNASSATSEQRSASNRMNNYIAIMMAGSYLAHSSPDGKRVQPVGE